MELTLKREPTLIGKVTFGDLYVDGMWQCHTMEDAIREVPGRPVEEWKVPKETAIPFGRYRLELVDSPKFGPDTLSLVNVPGFKFIRMHAGNTPEDTDGCILTGQGRHGAVITDSVKALNALKKLVIPELRAGREVYISVQSHIQEG